MESTYYKDNLKKNFSKNFATQLKIIKFLKFDWIFQICFVSLLSGIYLAHFEDHLGFKKIKWNVQ